MKAGLYNFRLILLAIVGFLLSCGSNNAEENSTQKPRAQDPISTELHRFYIDTLVEDLENPWGMTWLSDGRMLITERKGELLVVEADTYTGKKIQGMPTTYLRGQSGLLDVVAHPKESENGWIYATYAKPGNGGGSTTLIRFRLDKENLVDLEELLQTQPLSSAGVHFGSRIIFDKEGFVYFSTGDRSVKTNSQDLSNDMGKIHRLHDDGRIPKDNPFVSDPNARHSIWSYGHRNVQGLVYDSDSDQIYATEHGPRGGDELNLIEKGKNYGWPVITYGIDYDGSIISNKTHQDEMEQPLHYWTPSIAVCGLMLYTGDKFPEWKGNLFSGALAMTHVARIELKDGTYVHEEKLLDKIGRVRQVAQSPDGYIYVLTEGPGMLLKLVPAK